MPVKTDRPSRPTVTILVPARNEARNLELILPSLPEVHEVIVVDGHSVDDSEAVVRRVMPQARFLQQTRKGKGNALAVGFAAATGDIVVMFDADGSADATEIPAYVSTLLAGADFAKGSRVLGDGGSEDITWLRDAGNRALTAVTNVLFRTHYTDLCYGYNAFWRDVLPALALPDPTATEPQWGDGFEVETMINTRVAAANLQIHEVPSVELARIHGESNLNTFRDGSRVLRTILTERFRRGATAVPAPSGRHAAPRDRPRRDPPAAAGPGHDRDPRCCPHGAGPGTSSAGGRAGMALHLGPQLLHLLARQRPVRAAARSTPLLMRRLIPTVLYPGRRRVGQPGQRRRLRRRDRRLRRGRLVLGRLDARRLDLRGRPAPPGGGPAVVDRRRAAQLPAPGPPGQEAGRQGRPGVARGAGHR